MLHKRKGFSMLVFILIVALVNMLIFSMIVAQEEAGDDHEEGEVHWGYEGDEGPDNWASLSEAFALCGEGMAQSPIDITNATEADLADLEFSYGETAVNILNNGHTIQVNYDEGSTVTIDGTEYNLLQFHFHHPSEHTIDGEAFPMELHLVHADADGNLAVVGVMLAQGDEDNEAYASLWDVLPAEETDGPVETEITLNVSDLLPEERTFYHYSGSLTTPPCSEGVNWNVLTTPVMLSAAQVEAFMNIFELNARPVQPLNDRELEVDRSADM